MRSQSRSGISKRSLESNKESESENQRGQNSESLAEESSYRNHQSSIEEVKLPPINGSKDF